MNPKTSPNAENTAFSIKTKSCPRHYLGGGERLQDDPRWKYGVPPVGNANFAWLQHMIHHLSPAGGVCGTVLANGSLSSNTANEGNIRKNMILGDVVECIVAMPGQLFYSTGIPGSLWIMRKGKTE